MKDDRGRQQGPESRSRFSSPSGVTRLPGHQTVATSWAPQVHTGRGQAWPPPGWMCVAGLRRLHLVPSSRVATGCPQGRSSLRAFCCPWLRLGAVRAAEGTGSPAACRELMVLPLQLLCGHLGPALVSLWMAQVASAWSAALDTHIPSGPCLPGCRGSWDWSLARHSPQARGLPTSAQDLTAMATGTIQTAAAPLTSHGGDLGRGLADRPARAENGQLR